MPPPLVIPPEQPPSSEHEAGVEGFFSPDRLLQKPHNSQPSAISVKASSGLPPPPSLRRIHRNCRRKSSPTSDPKDKLRGGWQQYKRCMGSVLGYSICLFAAGVAILIGYWSLSPFCTNCHALSVWSIISSSSSAVETAALDSAGESVQPFSTLRINQLQVGRVSCAQIMLLLPHVLHHLLICNILYLVLLTHRHFACHTYFCVHTKSVGCTAVCGVSRFQNNLRVLVRLSSLLLRQRISVNELL